MFCLTTQFTHFIYSYIATNIIMVKDHSDSERANTLPPLYRLLFSITARVLSYAPCHGQDNTYHGLYHTSCGALAETNRN